MLLKILIAISFISVGYTSAMPLLPELPAEDTAAADDTASSDDTGAEDTGASEDTGISEDTGSANDADTGDTGSNDTGNESTDTGEVNTDTGSATSSTTASETFGASDLSGEKGGCSTVGSKPSNLWLAGFGLLGLIGRRRSS